MDEQAYIGDGVYVSFDRYKIKLCVSRETGDQVIYLEPEVYDNLHTFWTKICEKYAGKK